jgi:hypothetical protein
MLIVVAWSSYWFWSAQDNLENIYKNLESSGNSATIINYGTVSQVGFPNRFDVTINDISIDGPTGKQIINLPFIQIMRLTYNSSHQIIILPNSLSIYNFNFNWENAKASIVNETVEDRIILEAENLIIKGKNGFRLQAEKLQISLLHKKLTDFKPQIILDFSGIKDEKKRTKSKLLIEANLNLEGSPKLNLTNFVNSIIQPNTWTKLDQKNHQTVESFFIGNQEFLFSRPSYSLFK